MKKRLLAILLIVALVLATALTVSAESPFVDVKASDWFFDEVVYAYQNGLMNGVGGNKFDPNANTTRAMMVTMLYRLEGSPKVTSACSFSDVPAGSWYEDAVIWAAENGIVNGISGAVFAPELDLTREQMVTIFYRYADHKGHDVTAVNGLTAFADEGKISNYARKALSWANSEGLIQGVGPASIEPQGKATRAQIAAVFYRFCKLLEREDGTKAVFDIDTDSFWGQKGGWMVRRGDDYVWAGEDDNAKNCHASVLDGAISISPDPAHKANLMYMTFAPADTNVSPADGSLRLKIYVSDTQWLKNTFSVLEITSGKDAWIGESSLRWQINRNVITHAGWNDITLYFSNAEKLGGTFDPTQFKFLWFTATNLDDDVIICLEDVRLEGTAITPEVQACLHEKCPVCGGCLKENCDCTIEDCCRPCICLDQGEEPPEEEWDPWW
ncbi:MAG: S-layer homology domain-containing protein [Faecousia sp.]